MAMVRPPKKHSMVMVSSKTIENLQWSLQNHWNLQWFPKKHWTCQWSSQINILLKQLNYPVVTITILIWLCCSKVYCQSSLIFIAAHCSYKPNLPHPTFCMLIYCILLKTGNIFLKKSDFLLGSPSLWPLHWIYWSGHTFSLVLCDFHTAKWCKE